MIRELVFALRQLEPDGCPRCGGLVEVLLCRRVFVELAFQSWKMRWFPYRTYEWYGDLEDDRWGPAKWNLPDILRRLRGAA